MTLHWQNASRWLSRGCDCAQFFEIKEEGGIGVIRLVNCSTVLRFFDEFATFLDHALRLPW
jgi:hypothetical protein